MDRYKNLNTFRRSIGDRNFVRFLRNSGYSFELAYRIMFGKSPKTI